MSANSRRARVRSVQETLGSIALGIEIVVVFLAALVVFGLKALPAATALIGGGALVVILILTVGLLRYRWGIWLGWLLQAVIIAAGFLVAMMFIVGGIFAALWAYCVITGARIDNRKAGNTGVNTPPENSEKETPE